MVVSGGRPLVVGYDGSAEAEVAVAWAVREAALRHSPVLVVHAFVPAVPAGGLGIGVPMDPEFSQALQAEARAVLDQGVALARDAGPDLEVDSRLVTGSTAAVLLDLARQACMVVIGSRGRGGFRGLLLGSVGVQVSSHAACPVVVVRAQRDPRAARVVVGLDGSAVSRDALAFAFDVASRHGQDLLALHAWDMPPYDVVASAAPPPPLMLSEVADDELRVTAESLAGWGEKYPDVHVVQRVLRDAPDQALVEASEHASLVVVGSRGRGGFLGLLLGSVSHTLVHHSRCPVAVVRPQG